MKYVVAEGELGGSVLWPQSPSMCIWLCIHEEDLLVGPLRRKEKRE